MSEPRIIADFLTLELFAVVKSLLTGLAETLPYRELTRYLLDFALARIGVFV